ncbi:zinc-dependent metalloprotease, partial [Streptomyces zhihengii]
MRACGHPPPSSSPAQLFPSGLGALAPAALRARPVDEVGMDGFNRVWTSPNTLPTKAEIAKPADW